MTREAPLVPDVGVLALVPDTWGGPWQPRHHVLTRLANVFPVVWDFEPTRPRPAEWSAAIAGALEADAQSPSRVAARRAIAQQHDWDRIVREISCTMADRLGPAYRERLERARPPGPPSTAFRQ